MVDGIREANGNYNNSNDDIGTTTAADTKSSSTCIKFNPKSRILGDRRRESTHYGATRSIHRMSQGSLNSFTASSKYFNHEDDSGVTISDIIGGFGWFQFLVLLFSGLRESSVGYDAVVMSIILQPEKHFLCADLVENRIQQIEILDHWSAIGDSSNTSMIYKGQYIDSANFSEQIQCFRPLVGDQVHMNTKHLAPCESWLFPKKAIHEGVSLVAEWSLVCDRHWIIAFIESAYFFGLMTGNMIWGYYADKVGRRRAYLLAHTIALIAGWGSVVAPSFEVFALCRFLNAFGSIGYNIIYSIQVELIGTKYRAFSTTMNHLGWGLGVLMVPLANYSFDKYRYIVGVAPMIALIMYPWAFWLPESSRWLMAQNRFNEARSELIRAARTNGKKIDLDLEKRLSALMDKAQNEKRKQDEETHQCQGLWKSYRLLFSDKKLVRDTTILAYVALIGHMFYYTLTINFGYMKNLSLEANFISSGVGEWICVILGAFLLKIFLRKTCMGIFLFIMALSFVLQSLVDSGLVPAMDTMAVVTGINACGTLASLLLIFVALIVNQEVYPTVIRQTGSSVVNSFGESGSTLAPLLLQLGRIIGLWRADLLCAGLSILGAIGVTFLTKTDDIELSDV